MERPSFSSSLARAKTAKAPSPFSFDMRDAIRAMVESRILPFLNAELHPRRGPTGVPPPGNLDGCERKGLVGKAIRKRMKTNGEPNRLLQEALKGNGILRSDLQLAREKSL